MTYPYPDNLDTTQFGTLKYTPQYLRRDFRLESAISKARLYITAKGVFEVQINGIRVGDDVLPPGWTPYHKRIETLTYDVTDFFAEGDNTLGFILAPGWHSGRIGYRKSLWTNKVAPQIICQLEITYRDGKTASFVSDKDWKATIQGPLRFSDIYDGEIYDANLELSGWSSPGYNSDSWKPVETEGMDPEVLLVPKRHYTVKNKVELPVREITQPDPGVVIFDLGQNMVGIPVLKAPMQKGKTLKIRFAEMLQQDGRLYTENYRTALSTDYFTAKENGLIDWQPKFTFHGFRYVELSGYDPEAPPDKDWVKGIVQYSDFNITGKFTSSHDKLNQLQSNILWGLRGNFFDIPTDCPQRDERLGWTGDAQVFAPTSIYNADVHSFWASWLHSLRNDQLANGIIPVVVPNILGDRVSSGWSDACTVIPWEIYFRTGDKKVLEENYQMMKRWLKFYHSVAKDHIVTIHTFADWLQPYSSHERRGDTDYDLISTAYYARSVQLTKQTAEVLNYSSDYEAFSLLHDSLCQSFQKHFFDESGRIKVGEETQTGYLLALGFGLLPENMAEKAAGYLIEQIQKADNHLRTGFLGTPLLAPILDKLGYTDLVYEILFKETYPSWFFSINQGATTMWERWNSYSHEDGFGDARMNSFNHYAYGAIGQWMYERIAGISPMEPGYKKIRIAPLPGAALTAATGEYDSPYGKIVSNWKIENKTFKHLIEIPPNTRAHIELPVKSDQSIYLNDQEINQQSLMEILKRTENKIILGAGPGRYIINF
jgi:alpha-L-rhamnosidase